MHSMSRNNNWYRKYKFFPRQMRIAPPLWKFHGCTNARPEAGHIAIILSWWPLEGRKRSSFTPASSKLWTQLQRKLLSCPLRLPTPKGQRLLWTREMCQMYLSATFWQNCLNLLFSQKVMAAYCTSFPNLSEMSVVRCSFGPVRVRYRYCYLCRCDSYCTVRYRMVPVYTFMQKRSVVTCCIV